MNTFVKAVLLGSLAINCSTGEIINQVRALRTRIWKWICEQKRSLSSSSLSQEKVNCHQNTNIINRHDHQIFLSGYSDVGDNVFWWLYDCDSFKIFMPESLCWWLFLSKEPVTNIPNLSTTSPVTNIDRLQHPPPASMWPCCPHHRDRLMTKKTLEAFFHYSEENIIFRGVGMVSSYLKLTWNSRINNQYVHKYIWNVFQINVLLEPWTRIKSYQTYPLNYAKTMQFLNSS